MRLLIVVAALILAARADDDISDIKRKDPGYLFVYTKTLLAGKNETVCLTLHNAVVPTKALIDLKIREKHHTITKIMHSDHSCFELPVPRLNFTEVVWANLHLQIQLNGSIYTKHNDESIVIYPNNDITFVETDRAMYKPGDKVRIRVLVLTQEMKASKQQMINNVQIVNPHGFTVAVWDKVTTDLGLAQLDYQLTDATVLGKWKIKANEVTKSFQVKKYILPRFQIDISSPKTIYAGAKQVEITTCAKYSFERPIKGIALLKISYPRFDHNSSSKMETLKNGCATFKLTQEDFSLSKSDELHMNVVATITEKNTNQIETSSTSVVVKPNPFEMKFSEDVKHFQPGLPYKGKLKIVEGTDFQNQHAQICYEIAVKKSWNIKLKQCSDFVFDEDGVIVFSIMPVKDNVVEMVLSASSLNHTALRDTMTLRKWYSSSNSYLHIDRNTKMLSKCKSPQQFTVLYTTNKFKHNDSITFYYLIKTRNEILQIRKIQHVPRKAIINFKNELFNVVGKDHKFLKPESFVDRFILKFRLHNKIVSKSQLMVYYFTKDEIVANTIDIYVEKCLPNTVESHWMNSNLYPGEHATLSINTSPNSMCAISVTDKASSFISSSKLLNIHSILMPLLVAREAKESYEPNCLVNKRKKLESIQEMGQFEELRRRRRWHTALGSKAFDVYESFNNFGVSTLSNMNILAKPCDNKDQNFAFLFIGHVCDDLETVLGKNKTLTMLLDPDLYFTRVGRIEDKLIPNQMYGVVGPDKGVSVRTYFPETWLWELVPTGKTGRADVSRYIPHSITVWNTNVMCMSQNEGIGVGIKQDIKTFQPFFVEMILPYSVKRHETLLLQVNIYNYLNHSIPIRLKLGKTPGLEFLDKVTASRVSLCVKADDMHVHSFRVKATILGSINLTVLAEVESSYPSECGPETIINKRDVIYKPLLVEPEGYPTEFSKSALLCNGNTSNVTWIVNIPEDRVNGSEIGRVILNSDLMGPTIQNLEKLVNLPTGCGEQVMAVLAPNLHVLRYLKSVNKLTTSLRQRAVKNTKIGYQKILDYVHKDGSFSAFGYHDSSGSMFLTAFVVRTLQQAKEYIYVDDKVIKKATEWIMNHQLENGCFAAVSHVFHDMGGTSMENSTAALTAYVIISLLESKIEISQTVRSNAMYCIRGQHNPDKYTLAISTYALYLLNWESEADRYLTRLMELATRDGNMMSWSNHSGSTAANIEMTGYVLMSLLHKSPIGDNLKHANAVVRWLGTQRGSQGGFVTTQDTVVALDALSRYAAILNDKDPSLFVNIFSGDQQFDINISKKDRIKSKEIKLDAIPGMVKISSSGQGCLLAQLSISYNMHRVVHSEAFKVAVEVSSVSTIDQCSVATISPCVSYMGAGHSNMAVLEVSMPSGYEPDRATLFKLTDEQNTRVKKFEEFNNRVVLYFIELNNEPICVPFNINENVIVEDQVDATVKLYDYYNPEMKVFTTYRMKKCQPNEVALIPELSATNLSNVEGKVADSEDKKNLIKRDATNKSKYGLNSDFVNMDVEMATPSGMEGNIPIYAKPDKKPQNGK